MPDAGTTEDEVNRSEASPPQEARRADDDAGKLEDSPVLDDRPTDEDALDFKPYRDTIVDIIADPHTLTPFTIGIYGGWGSGKTSLMKMVGKRMKEVLEGNREEALAVWFNAWQYGSEDALWRALLLQVLDALRPARPEGVTDEQLARLTSPHAPPRYHGRFKGMERAQSHT